MTKKIFCALLITVLILITIPIKSAESGSVTVNITVSKDKFMDNTGAYTSEYNGISSWLYVGYDQIYGQYTSALGFDLENVSEYATQVYLVIPVAFTTNYDFSFSIYGSNDDSWSETSMEMPSADTLIITTTMPVHTESYPIYRYYDVTSFVMEQKGEDDYASFLLEGPDYGESYFYFHALEDVLYHPYLKVTYTEVSATISSADSLTESNLETTDITFTMEGDTFADSSLSVGSFTTNSSYVSVAGVTYNSLTSCTLTLINNRTDFDSDFSFSIYIDGSELSTDITLTADNSLTVTAVDDEESITISTDSDGIGLQAEDGEQITVTLSGGVFTSSLTSSDWSLNNFPSGVSIGSVTRTSDSLAVITLSGNASADGESISNAYINCTGDEYDEGTDTLSSGYITITSTDDDSPSISSNTALTLDEGATETLTSSCLSATDSDSSDALLSYSVTTAPSNGILTLTSSSTLPITTFTQSDINNGLICYQHDDSDTTGDSFTFTVTDTEGNSLTGQTFSISVNAIDDTAPVITVNSGLTVDENGNGKINCDNLVSYDSECDIAQILYKITTVPKYGYLCYDTAPTVPITSFYEEDLYSDSENKVYYYHDGSETTADTFVFSIEDTYGNILTNQIFNITVGSSATATPSPTATSTQKTTATFTPTPTPVETTSGNTTGSTVTPTSTEPVASPTLTPSGIAATQTAALTASAENMTIVPESASVNEEGIATVVIDTSNLPEGTAAIMTPDGTIINLDGSGFISLEIEGSLLNEEGQIEIFVLDETLTAFGSVYVNISEAAKNNNSGITVTKRLLIILAGAAFIAVIWSVVFIVRKQKLK